MTDRHILIVGGGPAGLTAACVLAEAGQRVLLVDQAARIGGAIFRQPTRRPACVLVPGAQKKRWLRLAARVAACEDRIDIRCSARFAGLDYRGAAMVTSDVNADGLIFFPRAVILATGASEVVRPRPGWTTPGVTTAGALQIALKSAGAQPRGDIVLAGSGPLLLAAGAQLAHAGNPPLAILEEGRPFAHPLQGLRLPLPYMQEAAPYLTTLMRHRVRILTNTRLLGIADSMGRKTLTLTSNGKTREITADHVGLHDGIEPNDYGLAAPDGLNIVRAGDCRASLGARAAEIDGEIAAQSVLATMGLPGSSVTRCRLEHEVLAQERLRQIFRPARPVNVTDLPAETVICRCEHRTMGDLSTLAKNGPVSARDLRLNGRFGMGPCQGRFCLTWASRALGGAPDSAELRGTRWPSRPIPIRAFVNAVDQTTDT